MSEDYEIPKDDMNPDALPEGNAEHTDYKPADTRDGEVRHRLSGMYQNWFLDYASYVILERSSTRCAAWRTDVTTRWPTSWARP